METRLAVSFWGFSHQSKGNVFRGEVKKWSSCFMSCRLAPRLEGEGSKFYKSKNLYRGGKLEFFQVPGPLYEEKAIYGDSQYFALLGPRTYIGSMFSSPRGYIAGQSLYRGKARNIFQSMSLHRAGDLGIFPSLRVHSKGYSFIFSTYFFIFPRIS